MKMKSESEDAWSCPTVSNPTDCSLPGSSVHGSFQARVLEWGAIAFLDDMTRRIFFFFNLLYLVFSEFPGSGLAYLISLGKLSDIITSNIFFCFFFSFPFRYSHCVCCTVCKCPTVLGHSAPCFAIFFISLLFSFGSCH